VIPILKTCAACALLACLLSCASAGKAAKPPADPGSPEAGRGSCSTRYPVVLVHGISQRDDYLFPYWGSVPEALRAQGASVYLAGHDAWGSIEDNAEKLRGRIREIRAETGAAKVDIIAHSKGGLESRYLISSLGLGAEVASLTTINTPHRGSPIADIVRKDIPVLNGYSAQLIDLVSLLFLGDSDPNVQWAAKQLSPEAMSAFNLKNPDDPRVYYQSWTSVIDDEYGASPYVLLQQLTAKSEGPNDGVVSVASAKWGRFRGIIGSDKGLRVSHSDVHGFIIFPAANEFDAPAFYVGLVAELARMGY
jgi:triacylglycerol lipase